MINKVTLIGYLGRDPEIRHLENRTAVGRLSVATTERYQDKNEQWQSKTEWHDVIVWRGLAEQAQRFFRKGSLVFIEGKLTHRKRKGKDGNMYKVTEVVANTIKLLEKREYPKGTGSQTNPSSNVAPAADDGMPF